MDLFKSILYMQGERPAGRGRQDRVWPGDADTTSDAAKLEDNKEMDAEPRRNKPTPGNTTSA